MKNAAELISRNKYELAAFLSYESGKNRFEAICGWKKSGSTGKGGCEPYYVQQFLREQSITIMENPE